MHLKFFSRISQKDKYISFVTSELSEVTLKLFDEIEQYCPLEYKHLDITNRCLSHLFNSDLISLNVDTFNRIALANDNLYCNEKPSFIDKIKFSILNLLSSKESKVLLDAFKKCNDLPRDQIISNFTNHVANNSCIKNIRQIDYDIAFKELNSKWSEKKNSYFTLRYKNFKRETKAAIIVANLISSYRKSFNKLPSDEYIRKFKASLSKVIKPKRKRVDYKGIILNSKEILPNIYESYTQVLVNSYIENNLSDTDLSQLATDKNTFKAYRDCVSSVLSFPSNSYDSYLFMEKADELCGGRCQNHCSATPIFSKRIKCLNDISKSTLEDIAKRNFAKILNTSNINSALVEYKQCISEISSMSSIDKSYFCQKNISSKFYVKESLEQLKKLKNSSDLAFSVKDEQGYINDISKCLVSMVEISKENFNKCKSISNDLVLSNYFKNKIDSQSSQIRRHFNICSDNYFYNNQGSIESCIKLSLDEIQASYLKLNHEFDDSANNLSLIYESMSATNPFKAIDLSVGFYLNTIRPNYRVNSDASYCRRKMKFVNTIVFHHTATSLDKSALEINNEHLSRGTSSDPWLMIGYHYLIHNPSNSDNLSDVRLFQGRELDVIGAHAGSNAYNSEYPRELYQQALNEKFSCGSRDTSFAQTDPEVKDDQLKVNATSIAIAFIGNFAEQSLSNPGGFSGDEPHYPADSSLRKAAEIVCMLQKTYPNIKMLGYHSMYRSTVCPGEVVEKLSTIKDYAKELGCEF